MFDFIDILDFADDDDDDNDIDDNDDDQVLIAVSSTVASREDLRDHKRSIPGR
jgi:hypothetical protein